MVLVTLGVIMGAWALGNAFGTVLIPAGIFAFGVVATVPFLSRWALLLVCAAVVAILALVGFNVALGIVMGWLPAGFVRWLPDWIARENGRLSIELGLLLAVVVFGAAAYFYLRGSWLRAVRWRPPPKLGWLNVPTPASRWWVAFVLSALLALGVILGLPPLLSKVEDQFEDPARAVPVRALIGVQLDALIIAERPHAGELPPDPAGGGFVSAYSKAVGLDVRFGVGLAQGTDVVWTRTGIDNPARARAAMAAARRPDAPAPERRPGADGVILLVVDGTPPVVEHPQALEDVAGTEGEVERWTAVARAARSGGWEQTAVFALLQTTDQDRLAEWSAAFAELGGAASVQQLGSQTVTDAAVQLAAGTSTAQLHFWLAMQHRPLLLFDGGEDVPRPLSIEQLFDDDLVRQCEDLASKGTCGDGPPVRVTDLKTPGRHLVLSRPGDLRGMARREHEAWQRGEATLDGRPLGHGSRMYFHPVLVPEGNRRLLYLDYWWYLLDNPAGAGKGAFCGAGLVIVGVTCFDHESDWEGVTVVLELIDRSWETRAVFYAQHDSVVRYESEDLRARWDGERGLPEEMRARIPDYEQRPLVYVAQGTHAGYASRCRRECRQVAADLEEGDYGGELPWTGNDTAACLRVVCLMPLPTGSGGEPASWNAFKGPWGRRHCVGTYYCDSGTPPAAPGQQDRYRDPRHIDGRADVDDPDSYEKADG